MPLPSAIQIGPIRYRVANTKEDYDRQVASAAKHFWGHIGPGTATITLDPNQGDDHLRWTLMHELLHGCWYVTDPHGEAFTEEQAIRILAGPLLDTLRRNPALVAFLTAESEATE